MAIAECGGADLHASLLEVLKIGAATAAYSSSEDGSEGASDDEDKDRNTQTRVVLDDSSMLPPHHERRVRIDMASAAAGELLGAPSADPAMNIDLIDVSPVALLNSSFFIWSGVLAQLLLHSRLGIITGEHARGLESTCLEALDPLIDLVETSNNHSDSVCTQARMSGFR